jgi:hypothetical protein
MPNFAYREKAFSKTNYVCILSWDHGFVGFCYAHTSRGEFLDAWLVSHCTSFTGAFYSFEIE